MSSPLYKYPFLYEFAIRFLYGSHFRERYAAVSAEIADGDSVLDVCAGDCALYRFELKKRAVSYLACDCSQPFLAYAGRLGISTKPADVLNEEIPSADVVVMMGSLYQFIPYEKIIIEKLLRAARKKVIITEPVRNWAQSNNFLLRAVACFFTRLNRGNVERRFTEELLKQTLSPYGFYGFRSIAGDREILVVFNRQ